MRYFDSGQQRHKTAVFVAEGYNNLRLRALFPPKLTLWDFVNSRAGKLMLEQFEGAGRVFAANLQDNNDHLDEWLRTYGGNKWKVGQVPKDAEAYLRLSRLFKGLKSKLQAEFANGDGLEGFDKVFDFNIADCRLKLANPYLANRPVTAYVLACWEDLRQFVALFPAAPLAGEQGTGVVATAATTPPGTAAIAYPWAEIEALAVRIELRKAGHFTPADKLVASAVAGLIDALREAEWLPAHATLPTLYAAFGHRYNRTVGTDRITATRTKWQQTARKALGLD